MQEFKVVITTDAPRDEAKGFLISVLETGALNHAPRSKRELEQKQERWPNVLGGTPENPPRLRISVSEDPTPINVVASLGHNDGFERIARMNLGLGGGTIAVIHLDTLRDLKALHGLSTHDVLAMVASALDTDIEPDQPTD